LNPYPLDNKTPIRSRQKDVKSTPKFDPTVHGVELEFDYESDDSFTHKITFSARKRAIVARSFKKSPIRKTLSQTPRDRSDKCHKGVLRNSSVAIHHLKGGSLDTLSAVAKPVPRISKRSPEPYLGGSNQNTPEGVLLKGFSFPAKQELSGPINPSYQRKPPLTVSPRARMSPDSGSFPKNSRRANKNEGDNVSVHFLACGSTSVLSKVDVASPLRSIVSSKVETPQSPLTNKESIFNSIGKAFKGVFGSPRAAMVEQSRQVLIASPSNQNVTVGGRDTPQIIVSQGRKAETPTTGHRRRPTVPVEFRFATEERIQSRQSGIGAVSQAIAAVSKETEAPHHGIRAEASRRSSSSLKRRRRSQDSNGEEVLDGDTKRRKIEAEALDSLRTKARDSGIASVEAWAKRKQTNNDQSL